jgi:16S rRNA (cytosine967-C5)-methyltransferase
MTPPASDPGPRSRPGQPARPARPAKSAQPARSGKPRSGEPRSGEPRSGEPRSGEPRSGEPRSGSSRPPAGPRADPARSAAYDVLRAVAERDAYANLMLPSLLRERGLTGRDAALATELAYGTLRGQGTYDAILAVCSDRGIDQIDPPIRHVLRLGAHQLLATRIQPHAAVATSVDLARDVAGQRPAGFVNAVLRKVATRDLDAWMQIAAPGRAADPVGYLAIRYSHPNWIVTALRDALGEEPGGNLTETEAALAADGIRPLVTLCATPGLCSAAELVTGGGGLARWSPFGAYLAEGNPADVAAVAQHRAAVQDEASQLVALALTRADACGPDRRWLDLAAGPGGKARLLAGLAAGQDARLLAVDVRPHRAGLVRAATAGTGRAAVAAADGLAPAWRPAAFDRVLADVPCSGLGALRRRPEARWRRTPADVAGLGGLQRGLLAAALDSARPGGVVAYVTCSPHLAETREIVAAVLAARDDVQVLDAPALLPEVPGLRCPPGDGRYAQFWPHRHGTDGIFLALLRRTAPG